MSLGKLPNLFNFSKKTSRDLLYKSPACFLKLFKL